MAAGWSGYFLNLLHQFGIDYPPAWANAPIAGTGVTDLHLTGAVLNLPAAIMMLLITVVLVIGIHMPVSSHRAQAISRWSIEIRRLSHWTPGSTAARTSAGVPPAGFEPAISTLKGWRPRPLDDGGAGRRRV